MDESDERAQVLPGRGKKIGAVYPNVLEKDNSFSVVKFSDEREVNEWQFSDLTLCYADAVGCDDVARTADEARVEAERLTAEATKETFAALSDAYGGRGAKKAPVAIVAGIV